MAVVPGQVVQEDAPGGPPDVCALGAYCASYVAPSVGAYRPAQLGGTAGSTNTTVTIFRNGTTQYGIVWYSDIDTDERPSLKNGTYTIRLNVTTTNAVIVWDAFQVCRVNSLCVSQETICGSLFALGKSVGRTGVLSATASGAPTTWNSGDRIMWVLGFKASGFGFPQSFGFTPDQNLNFPPIDDMGRYVYHYRRRRVQ